MTDAIYAVNAISAYHSVHALTKTRIQHMIRAKDVATACKVLEECDYSVMQNPSVEQIIENERTRVYEKFAEHCPDKWVLESVTCWHLFQTTTCPQKELRNSEQALLDTLRANNPKIKCEKIRRYFGIYINAWTKNEKAYDEDLWKVALEMRGDIEGTGPLFFWWVFKQTEFRAVKIILMGKQYGFDRDRIMQALGVIYERFD